MTPPSAPQKKSPQALRARVVTLPSGHHLMAEAPDAVLKAVRDALAAPAAAAV